MLGLQKHARPLTAITVATVVALAAFVPSIVSADRSTPAASAAAKKKKKKKKQQQQVPLIATVNGSFTVRYDDPDGFGGDKGPDWAQLKVVIKNAEIPFRAPNRRSAMALVNVRFYYEAELHTLERWGEGRTGCNREDVKISGQWTGWTSVGIREVTELQTNGQWKKYLGWQVSAYEPSAGIYLETISSYQQWEGWPLTGKCVTIETNRSDDHGSSFAQGGPSFAQGRGGLRPRGLGKLSSDGRSVRLNQINTGVDQFGVVSGSIKFNTPVER